MVIVDDGVAYAIPFLPEYRAIELPMTKEAFESAYTIWCCGASYHALAVAHGVNPSILAWCLVMRKGGKIDNYDVHYRPTNK